MVGSNLMYGTEATWRGQRFLEDVAQRSINQRPRATLGVLKSTPVSFLASVWGGHAGQSEIKSAPGGFRC